MPKTKGQKGPTKTALLKMLVACVLLFSLCRKVGAVENKAEYMKLLDADSEENSPEGSLNDSSTEDNEQNQQSQKMPRSRTIKACALVFVLCSIAVFSVFITQSSIRILSGTGHVKHNASEC